VRFAICIGTAEPHIGEHAIIKGQKCAALTTNRKSLGYAANDRGRNSRRAGEGVIGRREGVHDHLVLEKALLALFFNPLPFDSQAVLMSNVSQTLLHNEIECF
jgi:hypothetical protein